MHITEHPVMDTQLPILYTFTLMVDSKSVKIVIIVLPLSTTSHVTPYCPMIRSNHMVQV